MIATLERIRKLASEGTSNQESAERIAKTGGSVSKGRWLKRSRFICTVNRDVGTIEIRRQSVRFRGSHISRSLGREKLALKHYECMFLLDSGKWAIDPQGTENAVRDILTRCEAELVALTPFQEGKLAYEIEGQRKGLHLLAYFSMDGSRGKELARLSKLSPVILRHMVIQHPLVLFNLLTDALRQHAEGGEAAAPAAV